MRSCTVKRLSGVSVPSIVALTSIKCRLDFKACVCTPGSLDNTAWVDTEKLVQDLVAIQDNSVVIYVDVLCRKVGTLGIEHSAATSGAGFLAPGLQVPPRWKCACGLNTSRLRLASKSKCNSQ
jgi:hypothetical protein